ncbi:MAG: cytochrome c [Arenicellales bacterium]|jgi:mono/diheme cytochrome c family protein|nr:cytochrome c [Arenicellales bacterium]MDP6314100.1 cytochrome c [Arenicellales bacterium]|tara:strand:+ start:3951 stop:4319 length:369 start_codon:yes stop_codon:yes gene_type:complete
MSRFFLMGLLTLILGPTATGVAQAADGEKLFQFYCAQCHGTEGKGDGPNVTGDFPVDPRNFTETAEMNKLSDADIRNVIIDGGPIADKSPMMPPWGKTLNDDEVEALVQYLRQLCNCTGKAG